MTEELSMRAKDKISTALLDSYYKTHEVYPTCSEGIIIRPNPETIGGVLGTLFCDDGNEIERRFNIQQLEEKSEKLPKHGNFK